MLVAVWRVFAVDSRSRSGLPPRRQPARVREVHDVAQQVRCLRTLPNVCGQRHETVDGELNDVGAPVADLAVARRHQNPATWGPAAQLIQLDPLDEHAGAQVLLTDAPQAGTGEEAQGLSTRLGGLPLTLHAAGQALAEPTAELRSFSAYQQALASRSISLLPDLPASPDASDPEIARRLVGYTWELSLDQLAAEGLPLARPLLRLAALLAEAPFPRSLLTSELLAQVTGRDVRTAALDGALAGLGRYGLLEVPALPRTRQVPALGPRPSRMRT